MKFINTLNTIKHIPYSTLLWLFPVIFLIHEIEEWYILSWYKKYFINLPASTNFTLRAWIISISLFALIITFIAQSFKNIKITAYFITPFICFTILNGLQHIFWLFAFKVYMPGTIFGGFIGTILGIYLIYRSVN
jgi:hypothetical protein